MVSKLRPGIKVDDFFPIEDPNDQGTYHAWWGRALVHVKLSDVTKRCMIANELIGCRLAAALGLPTLPGEMARDPQDRDCWVTPRITSLKGASPPPPNAKSVAAEHPNVVAGMIAFDTWIHNIDRTEDNVLYDPRLGLWLIDHENAFAEPDGRAFATKAADAARTPLTSHGFANQPIDQEALRFWLQRIAMISTHVIDRPLDEANRRGLITKVEATWLMAYLIGRRDAITSLVPATQPGEQSQEIVATPAHNGDGQLTFFDQGTEE